MKALLVAAGKPVAPDLTRELAGRADLIVAVDGGAHHLLTLGLRPDVVVGDLDSSTLEDVSALTRGGVEVERHSPRKDLSDLDLALGRCVRSCVTSVAAIGVTGMRLDHTIAALGSLARFSELRPEIFDDDRHGWVLDSRHRPHLVLEGIDSTVSVFAMIHSATVTCAGFDFDVSSLPLEPVSSRGLSNVVRAERAMISTEEGTLLVLSERTPSSDMARARHD